MRPEISPVKRIFSNVVLVGVILDISYLLFHAYELHFAYSSIKVYFAAFCLECFFLCTLFFKPTEKWALTLVLTSVGGIAFGLEALLTVRQFHRVHEFRSTREMNVTNPRLVPAYDAKHPIDQRTPLELYIDEKEQGHPPSLFFTSQRFFPRGPGDPGGIGRDGKHLVPLAGAANRDTVYCNELGTYSRYMSDEYGHNNPPGLARKPVEIVAVGPSFVHGACVPPGTEWVARVREHYPRTLNLGWGGSGSLLMLGQLKEYAEYLRPKIVLWFASDLDPAHFLNGEAKDPLLLRYLDPTFSQNLRQRQGEVDELIASYIDKVVAAERKETGYPQTYGWKAGLRNFFHLIELREWLSPSTEPETPPSSPLVSRDFDLYRRILTEAARRVHSWGGELYYLYVPLWDRFKSKNAPDFVSRYGIPNSDKDRVIAIAKEAGCKVVDLYPRFAADADPIRFFAYRIYSHFTEEGNQFVADGVLEELSKRHDLTKR